MNVPRRTGEETVVLGMTKSLLHGLMRYRIKDDEVVTAVASIHISTAVNLEFTEHPSSTVCHKSFVFAFCCTPHQSGGAFWKLASYIGVGGPPKNVRVAGEGVTEGPVPMAMTAPVITKDSGQAIAMTAPVITCK